MAHIIGWGKMCVSVKTCWDSCKTKDEYLTIIFVFSLYTSIHLIARYTFLLASTCFFILCYYFQKGKDSLTSVWSWFYHFPPIGLYVIQYVRRVILLYFIYVLVLLTKHLFENHNVLFFVKTLYISNLAIIKEENDSSWQG